MNDAGDRAQTDQAQTQRPGFRLGRVFGVPVVISPWLLVVAAAVTLALAPGLHTEAPISEGTSYALAAIIIVLVYVGVFVHEISHVLVAKALGLRVGRIVMSGFGGVSEVLDDPGTAEREYLVAAVGPLTSILLVGISAGVLPAFREHTTGWLIVASVMISNGAVALFNLLPGLPLDGGRVARAVIWDITGDKDRATIIAGWIGCGLAGAIVLVALPQMFSRSGFGYQGLYLLMLAYIIFSSATVSIRQAKVDKVLPSLDTKALLRKAMPIEAQVPVSEALRRAHAIGARALVIVDGNGKPTGLVSEGAVIDTPTSRQPWVSISELSRPIVPGLILAEAATGAALMDALRQTPASEYLVIAESGAIRGVLALADVNAKLRDAGIR